MHDAGGGCAVQWLAYFFSAISALCQIRTNYPTASLLLIMGGLQGAD
jgi:hypothetical protein